MACECGCACCGPRREDSDVKPRAELEREKEEAERRIEQLERQLAELQASDR